MATHSSILAWRIPWTEEAGGLQSMGSQRTGYDRATNALKLNKPQRADVTELDSNSDRPDTKPSAQHKAQLGAQNRTNSQGNDFCLVREAWHFCKQLPKKENGKCSEGCCRKFQRQLHWKEGARRAGRTCLGRDRGGRGTKYKGLRPPPVLSLKPFRNLIVPPYPFKGSPAPT